MLINKNKWQISWLLILYMKRLRVLQQININIYFNQVQENNSKILKDISEKALKDMKG